MLIEILIMVLCVLVNTHFFGVQGFTYSCEPFVVKSLQGLHLDEVASISLCISYCTNSFGYVPRNVVFG